MKNLGKIQSIIISSVIVLVMVAGMIFSFLPMSFKNKDFESFAGAMKKSTTIDGGMSVEYEMKGSPSDEEISSSIKILTDIMREYGFSSVNAYKKGENKIRLDLNQPVLYSDRSSTEEFLGSVATGKLEFKNQNDEKATTTPAEGETVDPTLIVIDATKHIDKVSKISNGQVTGLQIDFNKEGKSLYSAASGSPLYMFVGGKAWPSAEGNELSANNDPSAVSMYLMFNSSEAVDSYYYTVRAGMMEIELDSTKVDIVYNTNRTALTFKVAGIILTIVVFVALTILLAIKYKGFAIAPFVSTLISFALELFLLQAMDWVSFGFSGFVALILITIVTYVLNAHIFSTVCQEFAIGKSISTATEDAYKKNNLVVIDASVIIFIIGIITSFLATGELVAVGTILAISAVFLAVSTLLFNKFILSLVFSIFEGKEKIFGLSRREEE